MIRPNVTTVILWAFCTIFLALAFPSASASAPYAAMVMDARTGKVLHSRNADTRLHPASLTKMMTLYLVFDAVERGEIDLDTKVQISRKAAAEPPSKLGLRAGQRISVRHLIRATAVKSANDAATALAEAISGSEAAFARRMNRMAKAMGMTRTTFKNAHGLTENGHLSTARDMTILGRHLFYDFPEYYNLFSRRQTSAGAKKVWNTNRKFLARYRGADGIKTGYTRAAGYNLVASAERGGERIIVTVLGGRSSSWRNRRVAELLDMGFDRAPTRVAVRKPAKPVLLAHGKVKSESGTTIRASGLVTASLRPQARPTERPSDTVLMAMQDGIENALAEAVIAEASGAEPIKAPAEGAAEEPVASMVAPGASLAAALVKPLPRPVTLATGNVPSPVNEGETVVVTRMSTSGGRQWAINVGRFSTRYEAEKVLLKTALVEIGTLDEALRKVVRSSRGFEANFVGLSRDRAELACRRLLAQNIDCVPLGPG